MSAFIIGQTVFTNVGEGEEVIVTQDMIDSVCEYLSEEGIECSPENFEVIMANLDLYPEEEEKVLKGQAFEVSLNDAEADILAEMRGEEDWY